LKEDRREREIHELHEKEEFLLSSFYFFFKDFIYLFTVLGFYLFLFIYSHVCTLFGSFLPPVPAPTLSPSLPLPSCFQAVSLQSRNKQ
jgi:hypothetical protein